jgi:hypothetical protein
MNTKIEVFSTAKSLSTGKTHKELTDGITAQQGIVEKLTKERDESSDTAVRLAKNVELENAVDELMQYCMAREIHAHTSRQAEDLFDSVAKTLSGAGIAVKDRTSAVYVADRLGTGKSGFLTRLF